MVRARMEAPIRAALGSTQGSRWGWAAMLVQRGVWGREEGPPGPSSGRRLTPQL